METCLAICFHVCYHQSSSVTLTGELHGDSTTPQIDYGFLSYICLTHRSQTNLMCGNSHIPTNALTLTLVLQVNVALVLPENNVVGGILASLFNRSAPQAGTFSSSVCSVSPLVYLCCCLGCLLSVAESIEALDI